MEYLKTRFFTIFFPLFVKLNTGNSYVIILQQLIVDMFLWIERLVDFSIFKYSIFHLEYGILE
jgi:hypothetical protein